MPEEPARLHLDEPLVEAGAQQLYEELAQRLGDERLSWSQEGFNALAVAAADAGGAVAAV